MLKLIRSRKILSWGSRNDKELGGFLGKILQPVNLSLLRMVGDIKVDVSDGANWFVQELHMSLFGGPSCFMTIAKSTSTHQIFPGMPPALMTGDNVIQRQLMTLLSAILTCIMIPIKNLHSGQFRLRPGPLDQIGQTDDGWNGENGIRSVDISGSIFQHLCFAAENQGKSTPGTADVEGFITLI
jgi:hypothetical protein